MQKKREKKKRERRKQKGEEIFGDANRGFKFTTSITNPHICQSHSHFLRHFQSLFLSFLIPFSPSSFFFFFFFFRHGRPFLFLFKLFRLLSRSLSNPISSFPPGLLRFHFFRRNDHYSIHFRRPHAEDSPLVRPRRFWPWWDDRCWCLRHHRSSHTASWTCHCYLLRHCWSLCAFIGFLLHRVRR